MNIKDVEAVANEIDQFRIGAEFTTQDLRVYASQTCSPVKDMSPTLVGIILNYYSKTTGKIKMVGFNQFNSRLWVRI